MLLYINILRAVGEAALERPVWIDMESSLRTLQEDGSDVFDLGKCVECAAAALPLMRGL